MKKLYLFLLSISLGSIAYSQNAFTITTPLTTTADLVTPLNTNVTSDTAEYYNPDQFASITGPLVVSNNSGTLKDVKVRRTQLTVVPGSSNFFCWDLCYTSIVSVSGGSVAIAGNDSVFVFYADYDPAGNIGSTYINYKFFNNADTTEFASVTVKFTSGILGVEQQEVSAIKNVYPNPANNFINFDFVLAQSSGSIVITDLTGKVVRTAILPSGSTKHTFALDGLNEGVYIYTLYEGNKAISTKKFIINK